MAQSVVKAAAKRLPTVVVSAALGCAIGLLQCKVGQTGAMQAQRTEGFAGIGVTYRYGVLAAVTTGGAVLLAALVSRRWHPIAGTTVVVTADLLISLASWHLTGPFGVHATTSSRS